MRAQRLGPQTSSHDIGDSHNFSAKQSIIPVHITFQDDLQVWTVPRWVIGYRYSIPVELDTLQQLAKFVISNYVMNGQQARQSSCES